MLKKIVLRSLRFLRSFYRRILKPDRLVLSGIVVDLVHDQIGPGLRDFFYSEIYEEDEVNILRRVLTDADVVMEVGAGIGFLSAFAAKQIGEKRVFAYEANPMMIEKIRETYRLNNVEPEINNLLLADREGNVDFFIEENFWSSSILKRSVNSRCVSVRSVDVNLEILRVHPTFLVVDIEGGEKDLLPIIDFKKSRIQKILMETHPFLTGKDCTQKLLSELTSQGFCFSSDFSRGDVWFFEKIASKF